MRRTLLPALLLAAACGDVRTIQPSDAGDGDGDAAHDAAGPGVVTVEVLDFFADAPMNEPVADVPVLFFGPDRELIDEVDTDDDGIASATVPPDSIVVIVPPVIGGDQLLTIAMFGVQPGDELRFPGSEPAPVDVEPLGSMNISYPASTLENVSYYEVNNGCQSLTSGELSQDPTFFARCTPDGEFDVLVRVYDTGGRVIDHATVQGTFDAAGMAVIDEWEGNLDVDVAFTNIPASVNTMQVNVTPAVGQVLFGQIYSPSIEPADDSETVTMRTIDAFGTSIDIAIDYTSTQAAVGPQRAHYRVAPGTDELALSLDEDLLPWYGAPVYSHADRELSWSRTGGGSPDGQYALVFAEPKGGGDLVGWIVAVPPDWTSVVFPELPPEYEDHELGDVAMSIAFMAAAETSTHEGYEIREMGVLPFLLAVNEFRMPDVAPPYHFRASRGGGF